MTRTPWWMASLCVGLAIAGCNSAKSASSQPASSQPMTAAAISTEPMAPQQVVSQAATAAPAAAATNAATAAASVPATAGEIGGPMDIQTALTNAGFYAGPIDGKIGPATRQAIESFQHANGLTADGRVGTKTWTALKAHVTSSSTSSTSPTTAQ